AAMGFNAAEDAQTLR
nr:33 kda Ca(2+)-dependent carbohydrate-binding protein, p33=annexin IV homolog {internal fragment 33L-17b} [cattle, kidney, Peptide Partial, 15 aa] [Bos taurus]